ncbi:MAG: hypothetical protein JOZ32_17945 [Bryobacterales bacterium]|nr:hypothetical protein [Bryobacterales bacterium]
MAELVELIAPAAIALFVVRLVLVRPPVPRGLPNPAKIGLPSGGMASPAAVHAVLGGAARPWWRFW